MLRKLLTGLLGLTLVAVTSLQAQAQATDPDAAPLPEPQPVTTTAPDGLTLSADLYFTGEGQPVVVLLHQLYSTRRGWEPFLPPLLDAGFNVLAVDLRGYGRTGGRINWPAAVEDVGVWLGWLAAQPNLRDGGVTIMGSSMGASLALVACAENEACRTAVAISPGWSYYGIRIEPAIAGGLGDRPATILYAQRDRWPALAVPQILEAAAVPLDLQRYTGNAHGYDLLREQADTALPHIIAWIRAHGG